MYLRWISRRGGSWSGRRKASFVRNIDVFCVFPEAVDAAVGVGVVGRAIENGIVGYRSFDLRDYSPDGRIDDMPYGGGAGMVVRVDVMARALEEVYGMPAREVRTGRRVVLTEPAGRRLTRIVNSRQADQVGHVELSRFESVQLFAVEQELFAS